MEGGGSIFVCFLCEKEFKQVTHLEEHMKTHDSLPELSTELPRRKRGRKAGQKKKVGRPRRDFEDIDFNIEEDYENTGIEDDIEIFEDVITNSSKITTNNYQKEIIPNKKDNYLQTKPKMINNPDINKGANSKLIPIPKLKTDATPKDSLTIRAMRIKQYILRQEETAKRKQVKEEEEEIDESSMMQDVGPQESIMMVDSSFFSSGTSSKAPVGPTLMNAEPDGFICPMSQNSIGFKKKKSFARTSSSSRDLNASFLSDIDDPSATDFSNMHPYAQMNFSIKRGRGRGKRGRPSLKIKSEEEDFDFDLDDASSVLRPGRRSQPRVQEDEDDLPFKCSECSKRFRTHSTLKIHLKSHAEDKEIHCPYCESVFPQRYILYEHLANDHEEITSLVCPICKKIFTRPDSLKSHMVRMHEENGGLNCFVCGKNFPSRGQLEMHVRVHTGERPFKCELCNKGFVQKAHLRTHLRTMHNVTDMPTTPCRLCDAKFEGRVSLREHVEEVHRLSLPEYRSEVARLRSQGKIPDCIPNKVKVVDPSFRYRNVPVSELDSNEEALDDIEDDSNDQSDMKLKLRKGREVVLPRKRGRKVKLKRNTDSSSSKRAPGMGTVMNLFSDEDMFTPYSFEPEEEELPKGRDQEELSIVESAFKVAEEMDQLGETTSSIIVSAAENDSNSTGIYYSVPVVLNSSSTSTVTDVSTGAKMSNREFENKFDSINMDDVEYAQFAAEHAHIDATSEFSNGTSSQPSRGSIIKAEPLDIYSGSLENSQAVEMFNM